MSSGRTNAVKVDAGFFASAGDAILAGELLHRTRITPGGGGFWRCGPQWRIRERRMDDSMWLWIQSGHGWCRIGESRKTAFSPGSLLLIPTGVAQAVWPSPGVSVRLYTAHFHALLDGAVDLLRLCGLQGVFSVPDFLLEGAAHCFARESTLRAPGWTEGAAAAVRIVLVELLRRSAAVRGTSESMAWPSLAKLQPSLRHIEERLDDPCLSVEELARRLGVGASWIRKLFQRNIGQSPIAVIRHRRIELARQLLSDTDLPIKEIAVRCGMPELPYFHRTFRSLTGATPASWRSHGHQLRGEAM